MKDFEITIKAVKAAAQNCENLDKLALEISVVNPLTINIDDKMWGFSSLPVNDAIKVPTPSTLRYIAIRSITVDSLKKDKENKCIIVNGDIDIPLESGKLVGIDETFVQDEKFAREIAAVLTDYSLEKALDMQKEAKDAVIFLQDQKKDQRF